MAKQRSSFAKLQRDKAKKERAATKRADRQDRRSIGDNEEEVERTTSELVASIAGDGELSASQLLSLIEDLHKRRAAGDISLEDFEDAKLELFARLEID